MIQNYVTGYLAGVALMLVFCAWRDPRGEVADFALLCFTWPLTILFIIASNIFDFFGLKFNIKKGTSFFGYRKATNPEVTGFGLTFFGFELQFFKPRV